MTNPIHKSRLADLARELEGLDPECLWSPDMVKARLVEMVRIMQIATSSPAPAGARVGWPEYYQDFGDLIGQADTGTIFFDKDAENRPRASRREVNRMLEAMSWQGRYLTGHPGAARVLKVYLKSKAYRWSFSKACRRRGWSRATAYNSLDRALSVIAIGLTRDGVRP